MMEFHVSRQARDRYQFDQGLFSLKGNLLFANFHAARIFAQRINQRRDLVRFPEQAIRAGQINALGLIDEILHFVIGLYQRQKNPAVMGQALDWLDERLGRETVDRALVMFADEFPTVAVYRRETSVSEYLEGETGGVPNRQIVLEEMLLLWLENANPACAPFLELFDDTRLAKETAYPTIIALLNTYFETQARFGPENQNLINMLHSPAIVIPHSLSGQLEYIRQRWATLLGTYIFRLLSSLDLIQEESKLVFVGAGPARVYDFSGLEFEAERFSPDRDWMPSLVMIAKNTFVWLDQLSKKYQRDLHRLDQIPDEEMDRLARWGFTGLWLIGLWERSAASQRIKQLRGNPEAVASAYSLFDYQVASDLGGDEAYQVLRERAWQRGIRLASDMVPNHMGLDSRWVVEHPDWFISLDYSPFPAYTFNGPNLSWEKRVGLFLEDHYYTGTDAAVVFKRVDRQSGETRFIYHGNDGTSMPWNDTAQLDYLQPEVREAVIQTILHVARKFHIIRFDAAMTLAKKHYQRLWFPEPGTGGAIPTRAEHSLTRDRFEKAFPVEFWREVVDRVAQEVPDTLLLAEAFWLMEGYFVRTLGMHRVYNSAFMNMFRDEKNQEYRQVIKNTVEFDPDILKRYVNFMNNPDERTAVDQFGKGDKYFGICTVMATMPGLPMFGHGQIEGFSEKYGMEYRRAYWDEQPDDYLIERHEREIFPLLRRRYLFAEVREFLIYDFFTLDGRVDENVFAYSNRAGNERSLVIYHNKYAETRGWIRTSAAFFVKAAAEEAVSTPTPGERIFTQKSLGEGLGLQNDREYYCIFRDHVLGLEYIRNSREIYEQGLYAELGAYKYHVFLDFREVQDNEWRQYTQLADYLNGRGVLNIEEALREIFLQPIHFAFRKLVNGGTFRQLIEKQEVGEESAGVAELLREINILTNAGQLEAMLTALAQDLCLRLQAVLELPAATDDLAPFLPLEWEATAFKDDPRIWGSLLGWAFTHSLGRVLGEDGAAERSRSWIDEWLLGKILAVTLMDLGLDESTAWRSVRLVKILAQHQNWAPVAQENKEKEEVGGALQILQSWLQDEEVQRYLGVNRYQGILWFNQESFEELLQWSAITALLCAAAELGISTEEWSDQAEEISNIIQILHIAMKKSEYQVEKLLAEIS